MKINRLLLIFLLLNLTIVKAQGSLSGAEFCVKFLDSDCPPGTRIKVCISCIVCDSLSCYENYKECVTLTLGEKHCFSLPENAVVSQVFITKLLPLSDGWVDSGTNSFYLEGYTDYTTSGTMKSCGQIDGGCSTSYVEPNLLLIRLH